MDSTTPFKFLLTFCLVLLFPTSAWTETESPWHGWRSSLLKDHALSGKIWSVRKKRFVAPEALAGAVAKARIVLVGEVHDNPDHHRLQAWLIEKASLGRKPAVVMEMISQDQAAPLREYLAKPQANAAGLGAALKWEKRGWPDWRIYLPIAETALRLKLPIRAGDIDRSTLMNVSKNGFGVLDTARRASLLLDEPLGTPLEEALLDELYDSHCKLMPRSAMGGMLNVQRLRDAILADSLLGAAGDGSAILIAGNGHVHANRAVPWYLARRAPDAGIATVLLLEADKSARKPEDLIPETPDSQPVADFIWFTPRVDREDPCEQLRKRFGKTR
ncbi:MAG: ChaN family lipoprotein [Hyphomicrobiaceae bacterium]|nr:ChaN family lipoprotein [Hyphomicrobiaceae bacterium]